MTINQSTHQPNAHVTPTGSALAPSVPPRKRGGRAHGQTGPKSPQGKARSAQNALRHGFYANQALNDAEAAKLKAAMDAFDALLQTSDLAQHPFVTVMSQRIAMIQIRMERVLGAEKALCESWRARGDLRRRFCQAVDLKVYPESDIPDWFFNDAQCDEKREAIMIGKAHSQASLPTRYPEAPQDLEQTPLLAELRSFVRQTWAKTGETLLQTINRRFQGGSFAIKARALTEAIETQQRWALCWMGAPQRYQAAIEQLKAQLIDEILNDPVRSKQLDSLERKLLNYLSLFEQYRAKAWAPTALEAG